MKYTDDLIEEVIRRNDLVELIGESVRLKRSGSNYTGLCPFHSEKTPSFHVSGAKQLYYCFGCHAGGNAITFMMDYHNYTFPEALDYLAQRAGVDLPKEELSKAQKEASERRTTLLSLYKKAASFYYYRLGTDVGVNGRNYLKRRGLSDETIKKFGLGYADRFGNSLYRYVRSKGFEDDELLKESGLFRFDEKEGVSDSFWNRVMFPIQDPRGRVIGFGGRVLGDGKPKYLNSPETEIFNKRRNLYALNYARSSRRPYLILSEGYMDVISMHQAGFDNAVASLGTALTREQAMLMKRFTDEVRLLYDSDGAGTAAAQRAIPILRDAGLSVKVTDLRPYKDPDELLNSEGAEALEERLEAALNGFLFETDQLSLSYKRGDPGEWTAFQHECAKRLLTVFPEELERDNYLQAVCGRYGFPPESMEKLIAGLARSGIAYQEKRETPVRPALKEKGKAQKADGSMTEELFLKFLAAYPGSAALTKGLVEPEDFQDPLLRKIYEFFLSGEQEGEARLIASFPEAEDERRAAGILQGAGMLYDENERGRAFTDIILKMLKHSNDSLLKDSDISDIAVFQKYIEKKRKIEEIERGRIFDPVV
jgi:DNA primase